jgi:hypothetical protein
MSEELTEKEERELTILQELQSDSDRWFSQEEFEALQRLTEKSIN